MPGIEDAEFQKIGADAKANCPVSRLLTGRRSASRPRWADGDRRSRGHRLGRGLGPRRGHRPGPGRRRRHRHPRRPQRRAGQGAGRRARRRVRRDQRRPTRSRSQAAVAAAVGTGVPLRIGISCAGIGWASRIIGRDGSPHDLGIYKKVIEVNLIGTFNLMRHRRVGHHQDGAAGEDGERGRARQHRLGGRLRRPDRPDLLLGVQGRRGRHDRSRRPATWRPSASGCARSPPACSTRRCSASCPRTSARRWPRTSCSRSASAGPRSTPGWSRAIVEISYFNGEVFRLDGGLRMPPRVTTGAPGGEGIGVPSAG